MISFNLRRQVEKIVRNMFGTVAGKVAEGDHTHDSSTVTNRTRRINLVPVYDRRTGDQVTYASTTYGSVVTTLQIEQADGDANHKVVGFWPVILPSDYVGGTVTLKWLALSNAAGNNYVFVTKVNEVGAGAFTALLDNTAAYAANASANTLSLHSIDLTVNPTAGRVLFVEIALASNHASDSNTGTRSLYGAWLEYTADM